ncbi:MAG: hypothetical protein ACRDQZ_11645 [Mycobacteriales bacterium]
MWSDGDYNADREFADRFLPHQAEIAREALRVDVAPIEEYLRRNTDLILRTPVLPKHGRDIRISARVRRVAERDKSDWPQQTPYNRQFTIRTRRVSGVETEMDKIKLGFGDMFVYGFEQEPGSDRLYPWFIGNLEILRDHHARTGRSAGEQRNKGPGGSSFKAFNLDDMPLGFVLASDGLAIGPCASCGMPGADTFYYEVKGWTERRNQFAHHQLHWRCCPLAGKEGRCVVCFKPGAPMTNMAVVGGPAHEHCIKTVSGEGS